MNNSITPDTALTPDIIPPEVTVAPDTPDTTVSDTAITPNAPVSSRKDYFRRFRTTKKDIVTLFEDNENPYAGVVTLKELESYGAVILKDKGSRHYEIGITTKPGKELSKMVNYVYNYLSTNPEVDITFTIACLSQLSNADNALLLSLKDSEKQKIKSLSNLSKFSVATLKDLEGYGDAILQAGGSHRYEIRITTEPGKELSKILSYLHGYLNTHPELDVIFDIKHVAHFSKDPSLLLTLKTPEKIKNLHNLSQFSVATLKDLENYVDAIQKSEDIRHYEIEITTKPGKELSKIVKYLSNYLRDYPGVDATFTIKHLSQLSKEDKDLLLTLKNPEKIERLNTNLSKLSVSTLKDLENYGTVILGEDGSRHYEIEITTKPGKQLSEILKYLCGYLNEHPEVNVEFSSSYLSQLSKEDKLLLLTLKIPEKIKNLDENLSKLSIATLQDFQDYGTAILKAEVFRHYDIEITTKPGEQLSGIVGYLHDWVNKNSEVDVAFTINHFSELSKKDLNLLSPLHDTGKIKDLNTIASSRVTPLSVKDRFKPLVENVLLHEDVENFTTPDIVKYIGKMLNLGTREIVELNKAITDLERGGKLGPSEKSDFGNLFELLKQLTNAPDLEQRVKEKRLSPEELRRNNRFDELVDLLDKGEREIASLEENIGELRDSINQKNAEKQKVLRTPIEKLFNELIDGDRQALQESIDRLNITIDGLVSQRDQEKEQMKELDQNIKELNNEDLDAKLEEGYTQARRLQKGIVDGLEGEIKLIEKNIGTDTVMLGKKEKERSGALGTKRSQLSNEIGRLKTKIQQADQILGEKNQLLREEGEKLESIGSTKSVDLKILVDERTKKVTSLKDTKKEHKKVFDVLEETIKTHQTSSDKMSTEVKQITDLMNTIGENPEELLLESYIEKIEDTNVKALLMRRYEQLVKMIDAHKDFEEEDTQIDGYKTAIENITSDIIILTEEMDILVEQQGMLQEKIDRYDEAHYEAGDEDELTKAVKENISAWKIVLQDIQECPAEECGNFSADSLEVELLSLSQRNLLTDPDGREDFIRKLEEAIETVEAGGEESSELIIEEDLTGLEDVSIDEDLEVIDENSRNSAEQMVKKLTFLIQEKDTQIEEKTLEIKTLEGKIEEIEESKIMSDSSLAKGDIEERNRLERELEALKNQQAEWDNEYNDSNHRMLKQKAENADRDTEIRAELVLQERENLLANDDMKALIARIEETIEKIDEEWLKNININNLDEVDLDAIIADLQPKYKKRWEKVLNVLGIGTGTSLVAASSGVGLGQLGLYFAGDKMTNEGAIAMMILGAILGGGAYLHNIKKFKQSAKHEATLHSMQGKKNFPWYKATFSKRTAGALVLMGILWFADSSAVGTLVQGKAKKDKTIAQIEATQAQYEHRRGDFYRYLDNLQVQNQRDFVDILGKEERGELNNQVGRGPRWNEQERIRNTSFQQANRTLDQQQQIPIGDISVKDGETIYRDEVGPFGSEIGSRWHGAESVLPSTSLKLLHFISSVGTTIELDIDNIRGYVDMYNTNIENIQQELSKMGSNVKLETFDVHEVNKKIDELRSDGYKIIKELEKIETYTDIVSMSKFVLDNMADGGMNAILFGLLVIGLLLLLHGTAPAIDMARTKKNLKKQVDFIKQRVTATREPWLENMVEKVFPVIEKTELGQELLVEEGHYTPEQLYNYLNNYQKFGQIEPGNREKTKQLKNEIENKLGRYLTVKDIFGGIDPNQWREIDREVGTAMRMKPSLFYKAYLTHKPTKEAKLIFMAALLEKSPTFKVVLFNRVGE